MGKDIMRGAQKRAAVTYRWTRVGRRDEGKQYALLRL